MKLRMIIWVAGAENVVSIPLPTSSLKKALAMKEAAYAFDETLNIPVIDRIIIQCEDEKKND